MITSVTDTFARNIAIPITGTGTFNVGDVIDTGGDGLNDVSELDLDILIQTAVTSGGSATVSFQLVSDTVSPPSTSAPAYTHLTSKAYPVASLIAGFRAFLGELPKQTYARYVGVQAVVGTAALTAGSINAVLTPQGTTWEAAPAGI